MRAPAALIVVVRSSPAATPPLPRSTSMTLPQACDSAVAVIRPVSPPPMTAMSCIIASSAGKMPVDDTLCQNRQVAAVEQVAVASRRHAGGDVAVLVPDHHRRGEIYVPFFRKRQKKPRFGLAATAGRFHLVTDGKRVVRAPGNIEDASAGRFGGGREMIVEILHLPLV